MKRILLESTAALLLLPAVVMVADKPASAAPFEWTGFYIGAQTGGVWSKASISGSFSDTSDSSRWSSEQSWASPLLGGFVGYDYQFGRIVLGFEGDLNARFNDSTGSLPSVYGIVVTKNWESESTWDASLRARFGVLATDQFLFYVTGGAAFSNFRFSNADVHSNADVYWGTRNIYGGSRTGWTLGAGGQWAFTQNWSLRLEYRYSDYGTESGKASALFDTGKGATVGSGSHRVKIVDNRVTIGLAYKFDGFGKSVTPRY